MVPLVAWAVDGRVPCICLIRAILWINKVVVRKKTDFDITHNHALDQRVPTLSRLYA